MKPEKRNLLEDVLNGARRDATLRAGGQILRRRRWRRAAARTLTILTVLALAVLALHQKRPQPVMAQTAPPASNPPTASVHYLTDDELLALFPGTPVGLITTADGRKHLIFPHPGDEEKYITRL